MMYEEVLESDVWHMFNPYGYMKTCGEPLFMRESKCLFYKDTYYVGTEKVGVMWSSQEENTCYTLFPLTMVLSPLGFSGKVFDEATSLSVWMNYVLFFLH